MSIEQRSERDPRIERAVSDLQAMIRNRYPAASFKVTQGDDPAGTYLWATVDLDDPDEVVDAVIERVVDLQVEERLPIHLVPIRPLERVLAELGQRRSSRAS